MSDFPTKEKPKLCDKGCGCKIYLGNKNESRRYLPYELDGTVHDCGPKSNVADTKAPTIKTDSKEDKVPTVKELDASLRKLESLVLGD